MSERRGRLDCLCLGAALWFAETAAHGQSFPLAGPLGYLSGDGTKAYPVVSLTWGLLGISIAVVVIVGLLVLGGAVMRRAGSAYGPIGSATVERPRGGLRWIIIGVGVSSVALIISLIWTVAVVAQINEPLNAAPFTVEVTGHQWWWEVRYLSSQPGQIFRTANEIHLPTGRPVRFVLKGADVIHSFWVPALGGKMDTIPGQTNVTWLEADHPGRYAGQCTEFCGLQHAHMGLELVAEPPAAFEAWWQAQTADAAVAPRQTAGEQLFLQKCGACHAVRGTEANGVVAPDLTHLMSRREIAAGAAPNTPAGLAAWIANPQSVKPGTKMPTLYLSGPQLEQVRGFLETLS